MPPNLPAFALFAVATSVTPEPNIVVASLAASNGVRATVPQMLGISLGFGAMAAAALFAVLSIPCTLLWSLLGAGAGRILRSPVQFRASTP